MGGSKSPRKTYEKACEGCARKFTAFRSTARFCSDVCKANTYNINVRRADREEQLKKAGGKCSVCGDTPKRLFIRTIPGKTEKTVLCGVHNSKVSLDMFRKRVPVSGPHYAKRLSAARRAKVDMADLPPSSPGVYSIRHRESGREYVGRSMDLFKLWMQFKADLNNRRHWNRQLQREWTKFGEAAFEFLILSNETELSLPHAFKTQLERRMPAYNRYLP